VDVDLLIRADAGIEIGTGHVMRCLALAQGWREAGGDAVVAMATGAPSLEKRLAEEGFEFERLAAEPGSSEDAAAAARLAQEKGASWVVVDGYHFGYDYQRALKDAGLRVLFVDDNGHAGRYCADIVLNQNLHADEAMYADREPHTRLLLGTRYVLLRREFLKWKAWRREIPDVARKLLVTMGGAGPENVTLKVVEALAQVRVNGLEAVVAVGGGNPHHDGLCAAAADSPASIRVERDVRDMPELMAWADVAVSAAGSTCWELAFMGLPQITIVTAENQELVGAALAAMGPVIGLGRLTNRSAVDVSSRLSKLCAAAPRRRAMSSGAREQVDGQGAERVAAELAGIGHGET
jgi:UDP-2,4-diacetamido-2,4,6-trideoxy-beta-L-altropyranose hydrolase